MLESFGDGLPSKLDELGCIAWCDAICNHLVEAQNGTCLQHAAQDGLLTHEIALHLSHEGAQEDARAVAACGRRVGLGNVQALAQWVVLGMHRDQRRHAEAALVLLSNLGARALWSNHHHGEVFSDLHALLHDVETVAVSEGGILLHQRHDGRNHTGVLLVRSKVADHVSLWHQLLIGPHLEAVGGRVEEALSLALDGVLSEGVAHIAARVPHVEPLIQSLCSAADDDNILAHQLLCTLFKFLLAHEAASAELVKLVCQAQGVEVVGALLGREAGEGLEHGGPVRAPKA
mmetsp:Transcript_14910/g.23701  ORF Transcript_14910/g.23701 Transcript_14910/m.23701 type:complete len:289 (+) Transcript_14910:757-1623(+)